MVFDVAAERPWDVLAFLAVVCGFLVLVLAGVDLPFVVPLLVAAGATLVAGYLTGERRRLAIVGPAGRRLLVYWSRRGREQIALDELASAEREGLEEAPALTLADRAGGTLTVPLGTWAKESQLLYEVERALRESGADGSAGSAVPVRRGIPFARALLLLAALVPILLLIDRLAGEEVTAEPVTPERIEQTRGETPMPFEGSNPCTVYVVPLDRPSEERANDLARALTRFPVFPCAMPSLALDTRALDLERGQLDASILARELYEQFFAVWKDRPSTVLGITEHDLYSSGDENLRFVFGTSFGNEDLQGFAAISTARMGTGDDLLRRLETMAVRHVGLRFFGLETSDEQRSALYHTIDGRGDLDRMHPELGDPPLSQIDLRQARARYLATG